MRYRNRKTGQVVERERPQAVFDRSAAWVRLDESEEVEAPASADSIDDDLLDERESAPSDQVDSVDAPESEGTYDELNQPELKAKLTERGIEFPSGPVRNEKLRELLEAADAEASQA